MNYLKVIVDLNGGLRGQKKEHVPAYLTVKHQARLELIYVYLHNQTF